MGPPSQTAIVAAVSVLAGLVVYGAVMAVYRIAQARPWPPALTNLSAVIALAGVWFLIGRPVTRVLNRRSGQQQSSATIGEVNAHRRTLTKGELIWKIGVLYWGGLMFLFFAIVGPIIPHFTIGKPLTMPKYIQHVHLGNHLFSGWRYIRLVNVVKCQVQSKRMSRQCPKPEHNC